MSLSRILFLAIVIGQFSFAMLSLEEEVRAYESLDLQNPPPKSAVVAVGSSSIRIWQTMAEDFSPVPILNRGFGGSQMSDLLYFESRLVFKYQPKIALVYEGDNDLESGKTPERILSEFEEIEKHSHQQDPKMKLVFLSIKPSPARLHLIEKMRRTNQLVEYFCKTKQNVYFLNVFDAMLTKEGTPRPELFQKDGLHMNAVGYGVWKQIIVPYIKNLFY